MPAKVEYEKGQRCGKEDNCKSTLYYVEDALTYCKRGHLQEVNRHLNQMKSLSDGALFRGEQPSRMRMTLAPRGERVVLEEKNMKGSPNVRLHPVSSPHHSTSLTKSSLQRYNRYRALPSILSAHPLETMPRLNPHHWPSSRARGCGQRLMGITLAVAERQNRCYL